MTYSVSWNEAALNSAAGHLDDDAAGVRLVFDAVDRLVEGPRPEGSTALGSPDLRRLHVGRYRLVIELDEASLGFAVKFRQVRPSGVDTPNQIKVN